jgi:hypothetical protein
VPADLDVAGVGRDEGRQDAHHRRLPGTVGPEQGEDGAFRDGEIDPVEHDVLTEGFADGMGADCRPGRVDRHGLPRFQ